MKIDSLPYIHDGSGSDPFLQSHPKLVSNIVTTRTGLAEPKKEIQVRVHGRKARRLNCLAQTIQIDSNNDDEGSNEESQLDEPVISIRSLRIDELARPSPSPKVASSSSSSRRTAMSVYTVRPLQSSCIPPNSSFSIIYRIPAQEGKISQKKIETNQKCPSS